MENLEKKGNNDNLNKKNKVKKVRIIKNGYGNEKLLKDFYDYLEKNDIQEVFGVEKADLIISLGGDGTMLISAKEAITSDIPVLAINMGSLGYLAEVNPKDAVKMLQNYENGNYKVEERTFLEVKYQDNIFYALNELVITKGGHEAHLTARPIIVNGCEVLSFKATSRDDAVHLNIDGNQWLQIQPNDLVSARLSKKKIRIIKPTNSNYYSILRQKLKWGDSVL